MTPSLRAHYAWLIVHGVSETILPFFLPFYIFACNYLTHDLAFETLGADPQAPSDEVIMANYHYLINEFEKCSHSLAEETMYKQMVQLGRAQIEKAYG